MICEQSGIREAERRASDYPDFRPGFFDWIRANSALPEFVDGGVEAQAAADYVSFVNKLLAANGVTLNSQPSP